MVEFTACLHRSVKLVWLTASRLLVYWRTAHSILHLYGLGFLRKPHSNIYRQFTELQARDFY
jgi:hypothetical protein